MAKKRRVYIERLNFDAEYIKDMTTGNGFRISEKTTLSSIDNEKDKAMFGLYSPLYGTDYSDEQAFVERYSCKCQNIKGKMFEGEICPVCKTKVEYKDINIKFTGWLDFGNHKILSPFFYEVLNKALGTEKKVNILKTIISSKQMVDINGVRSRYDPETMGEMVTHPYVGVGLTFLREHFLEILDYFEKKKPKNHDRIQMLRDELPKVWTSHIPVYSTFMRPMATTSDSLYYTEMDKQLSPLLTISQKIADAAPIEVDNMLTRAQERVQAYWDINFKLINGKPGWIRQQIAGGSLNFTARNVVIPNPRLTEDQCILNYHTFIELYKFHIIKYLQKYGNLTLSEAYLKWCEGYYKFDALVYETMKQIIKEEHTQVILNRNPTLHYYSILLLDVVGVKSDFSDYTLSINLPILPGCNMDFDGDVPNLICLVDDYTKHIFRKYRPSENMLIRRDTNKINPDYRVQKSQMIDLYYFCTMD